MKPRSTLAAEVIFYGCPTAPTLPPGPGPECDGKSLRLVEGRFLLWERKVPFGLQGLTDYAEGQARRITLTGEHPGEPPGQLLGRQAPGGPQLALDELP